jgi:molybdopterin molybdotransferase
MISVHEATVLIQQHTPTPQSTARNLIEAAGLVLACNYNASEDSPRFTNSAMDGFAVRFADIHADTPLSITDESSAGSAAQSTLASGAAIRISTGALVPAGADTIVPVEDCLVAGNTVNIVKMPKQGQFVRKQASEYAVGTPILRKGETLTPARIALAAQHGLAVVDVFAPPQVALLSTGNELVNVDETPVGTQIRNANVPMLTAAIRQGGANLVFTAHAQDDFEYVRAALDKATSMAEVVVTTGGASVGEHDFIKQAAQALGFETIFWRVRQKPGKPMFFAKRTQEGRTTLLFGLPGNPVSTLMTFLYYVQPTLAQMMGKSAIERSIQATLSADLANMHGRAEFVRVRLEKKEEDPLPVAVPLPKQDSNMLTSMTEADGFVFLDVDAEVQAGSSVRVVLFY